MIFDGRKSPLVQLSSKTRFLLGYVELAVENHFGEAELIGPSRKFFLHSSEEILLSGLTGLTSEEVEFFRYIDFCMILLDLAICI